MSTRARKTSAQLLVRRLNDRATKGVLEFGPLRMACALGRGGILARKREGDGATPRGRFRILAVYFNPCFIFRPITDRSVHAIRRHDGWCDAPDDRNYNRAVRHPYRASAERLWRDDGIYDVVVVLDYNVRPRQRNLGSAIFLHVARDGYLPTEGCIALKRRDLLKVLRRLPAGDASIVTAR